MSLSSAALFTSLTLNTLFMIWTDGSVPFPFGKGGSGLLANCSFFGTEATLSFSAGPVYWFLCLSLCHSASSLLVSAAPTSLPFLFSSYLTLATLFSPPSFLLSQSLRQKLFSLSSCTIRLPGHLFLPGNDVADKLGRREALLVPFVVSLF